MTRQDVQIEKQRRMAKKTIPDRLDYAKLTHMRTEAREKLSKIRPSSMDQASRISGITPADLALLMAHLDGR
jgi:tRNA uridine 5-carboxymethylaminomethyl modification enzyme